MIYNKRNLNITCDLEVKEIRKDEHNIDLIIPMEQRCVNLYFENLPTYINSRIQFPSVKSVLIRFCIKEDDNICTMHFLSDSGIYSSLANFEINYSQTRMEIQDKEFFVDIKILEIRSSF